MNAMPLLVPVLLVFSLAAADEITTEAPIRSLGLFKNGLAVVERSFTADQAGLYRLDDLPEPVHGTFHIECAAPFTVRVRQVEEEVPVENVPAGSLQSELAGKRVKVFLKGGRRDAVSGVVRRYDLSGDSRWNRDYQDRSGHQMSHGSLVGGTRGASPSGYLILDTGDDDGDGAHYLNPAEISRIELAEGEPKTVRVRRPTLVIGIDALAEGEAAPVTISYLSKGLGWAPSYRLALGDDGRLALKQNAVVKNELADIADAEVSLISGYPNVAFSHADDPMSLRADWAQFFAQVTQGRRSGGDRAIMSQTIMSNTMRHGAGIQDLAPAEEHGASADIHYQLIGAIALGEGEALSLRTAEAGAEFDRIVQWVILDDRDEYGRENNPAEVGEGEGEPWDAITFRNPFDFPMTTAPAAMFDGVRFLGQSQSGWVNMGGRATIPLTRALSVSGAYSETEEDGGRGEIRIFGLRCREAIVEGSIELTNRRSEAVEAVIRRHFSGDLIEAQGEPAQRLLGVGARSLNPRQELVWRREVAAGETVKLSFRYKVYVRL